jgi:hypothetical protein
MKNALWAVSLVVAGLGLGGCATTGSAPAASRATYHDEIDQEKIVSVNKWANDRGYGVTWINLPRKARKGGN